MSLYKLFKTNENLETDGIWLEYGQTADGKPIEYQNQHWITILGDGDNK